MNIVHYRLALNFTEAKPLKLFAGLQCDLYEGVMSKAKYSRFNSLALKISVILFCIRN